MDTRTVWTNEDFNEMSWHDCPIHGMSFSGGMTLILDIDYISQWIKNGNRFEFRMAPCTLIFENVYNFEMDLTQLTLTIIEITRENPRIPVPEFKGFDLEYDWSFEFAEYSGITFTSTGFRQYARANPIISTQQRLTHTERKGISFEIPG